MPFTPVVVPVEVTPWEVGVRSWIVDRQTPEIGG